MPFLNFFDIKRIIFGITLFGYGVFTLQISNAQETQFITIPYRAFVLLLNFVLFFHNMEEFRNSKFITNYRTGKNSLNKFIIICTFIFLFLYSCRLVYSVYLGNEILLYSDKNQYVLYWFCMCVIPGINFLFLEKFSSIKYIYVAWISLALIIIPSLFKDIHTSSQFSEQGRLATAAINPISLGHYATSVSLISFYIILNKSSFHNKLPSITNHTLVYLTTFATGIVITFLAGSRGPLLALLICSVLLLTSCQLKNKISNYTLWALILLLVLFCVSNTFIGKENLLLNRLLSTGDDLDGADSQTRGYVYYMAIQLFLEHPIIGFGLELPNAEGYPHNLYLESFLAIGVSGGLIFIIIVTYTLMVSIKLIFAKSSQWQWIGVLFIQYFIGGCFSGALYGSSSFWYFLFAILGIYGSLEK